MGTAFRLKDLLFIFLMVVAWGLENILEIVPEEFSSNKKWIYLAALMIVVILYSWQIGRERFELQTEVNKLEEAFSQRNKQLIESAIEQTLMLAATSMVQNPSAKCRANVFTMSKPDSLQIKYHYNMKNALDKNIILRPRVGATGRAWAEQQQIVADLTLHEVPEGPTWGLTDEQKKLTEHVKAIICTPVWDPENPHKLLGVFSVDSEEEVDIVDFKEEETRQMALHYAGLLGGLLHMVGVQ